jgi:hypothetical protein
MTTLKEALNKLKGEQRRLAGQLQQVNHALSALSDGNVGSLGPASDILRRVRIAATQRARWAKMRAAPKGPSTH